MRKRNILLGLLVVMLLIQFIRIDKVNPASPAGQDFVTVEKPPAAVASILKNACYDCHSHQTTYPWYTNLAPVSWMIRSHIKGGRQHVNFSTWGAYDAKKRDHKLAEIAEEVGENRMPMKSYTWLHSEAKLSAADREILINWVKSKTTE